MSWLKDRSVRLFPYRSTNISGEISYRKLLWLAFFANFAFLYGWAALTPPLSGPDENVHFNSIVRVAHGGGWPEPGDARIAPGVETAMKEASLGARLSRSPNLLSIGPPIWEAIPVKNGTHIDATNALQTEDSAHRDQMSQHPPLFYGVQAAAAKIANVDNSSWNLQLGFSRFVGLMMCTPLPILIGMAAREWGLSRRVSSAASFLPLAIPQYAFANSVLTNDTLAVLLCSVVIWLVVRANKRGLSLKMALIVGVAAGLAMLTKGTALPVVAFAFLGLFTAPGFTSNWQKSKVLSVSALAALVAGGWWWVLNIVRYGALQPNGLQAYGHIVEGHEPDILFYFNRATKVLAQTFYGYFGRLELPYNENLSYLIVGTIVLAAVVSVIVSMGKRWMAICLFMMTGSSVLQILKSALDIYERNGLMPGIQGRYLFASMLAITLLVAISLSLFERWRYTNYLIMLVPLVSVLLGLVGFLVGLRGYYQPFTETIRQGISRWLDWSMYGSVGAVLAVMILTLTGLVSLYALVSLRPGKMTEPPSRVGACVS